MQVETVETPKNKYYLKSTPMLIAIAAALPVLGFVAADITTVTAEEQARSLQTKFEAVAEERTAAAETLAVLDSELKRTQEQLAAAKLSLETKKINPDNAELSRLLGVFSASRATTSGKEQGR